MHVSPWQIAPKHRFLDRGSEAKSAEVLHRSHAPGRRCCGFQTTLGAARKDSRTLGAQGIRAKGPWGMLWVCLPLKRVVAALRKTPRHPTSPQATWMWRGSDHLISPPLPLPLSHWGQRRPGGSGCSSPPRGGRKDPASRRAPPKAAFLPSVRLSGLLAR